MARATETRPDGAGGAVGRAAPSGLEELLDALTLRVLVLAVLVGAGLAALVLEGPTIVRDDAFSGAAVVFVSIAVEALPFVLLGALVSGVLAVFVPDRVFARIGRLPRALQIPVAACGGIAFPVCECGSVPVARRLALRGLDPAAAVSFMLAAPILNPVVIASTLIAFRGNDALAMTAARMAIGFVIACVVGVVVTRRRGLVPVATGAACEVDGGGHDHGVRGGRVRTAADHATADFLFMARFVIVGAALAAAVQTVVPTSVLTGLGDSWILAPLVLMLLAFVLSLCSSADAFVGASFAQFGGGAQLAFLTFGPILDLKLALMYGATFGRGFVVRVAVVTIPIVLAGALLMDWLVFA